MVLLICHNFVFVDFSSYIKKGFDLCAFTLCMTDEWREKKGIVGEHSNQAI